MKNMTNKSCKRAIREHSGSERIINDSLHFGISIYSYTEDVHAAGIAAENTYSGKNTVFTHLNIDGADQLIDWLEERDGLLYEL